MHVEDTEVEELALGNPLAVDDVEEAAAVLGAGVAVKIVLETTGVTSAADLSWSFTHPAASFE